MAKTQTVREFVTDYLKSNKSITRKDGHVKATLAIGLSEALVQYFGGDPNFSIPAQPNELDSPVARPGEEVAE